MDKERTLSFIREQMASGMITPEDLANISKPATVHEADAPSRNVTRVLYGIGAVIAVIGVSILLAEHWDEIGFLGRVVPTLGIAVATFVAGILFKNSQQKPLSEAMLGISAILAPLGSYVFLHEIGITLDWAVQLCLALVWAVLFAGATWLTRRSAPVLATVGFATWAYYAFLLHIVDVAYGGDDFIKWATIVLGIAYILIAYGYASIAGDPEETREKQSVRGILYDFGTLAILGAGIDLGGVFDLFYVLPVFAGFYGSVYLKSRGMLILSALFLVAYIIKLTSKYFVDSVGWPVALIVIGFLVIAVGYLTFYLNRKYIVRS
ncbi:MAG TPA: DUF2157 domain-containing protein [Candidatus Paceibacterota bacterium]|nr:DUF2157 domain-containing protein [Candidatus Paceibacterota bacterium]